MNSKKITSAIASLAASLVGLVVPGESDKPQVDQPDMSQVAVGVLSPAEGNHAGDESLLVERESRSPVLDFDERTSR